MGNGIAILVFGFLVLGLEVLVLLKREKMEGFGPQAVRIVGVTLMVTIAAFLAVTSQAKDQFSQMVGLLGTIAGYLVGRSDSKEAATGRTRDSKEATPAGPGSR
jgi:hypothetical protein